MRESRFLIAAMAFAIGAVVWMMTLGDSNSRTQLQSPVQNHEVVVTVTPKAAPVWLPPK